MLELKFSTINLNNEVAPMDDKILIAIITASAAISGALVSNIVLLLQQSLERSHEKNAFLRHKYEEMANHLNESHHWEFDIFQAKTLNDLAERAVTSSALKAYSLSQIYFPLLLPFCKSYLDACNAVREQITLGVEAPTTDVIAQAFMNNNKNYRKAMREMKITQSQAHEAITKYANEYAKI